MTTLRHLSAAKPDHFFSSEEQTEVTFEAVQPEATGSLTLKLGETEATAVQIHLVIETPKGERIRC